MKTWRGVGDDGRPSPAEARRSWGEDSFLSPKRATPEAREPAGDTGEEKRRTKASRRE